MPNRLIIEGNSVYEIDEECERGRINAGPERQRVRLGSSQNVKTTEKVKKSRSGRKNI